MGAGGELELTVESLIAELGLELASGRDAARAHVRWVHSTELVDPTPWLKGGELLLTTGMQLTGPKIQRELIDRLSDHEIAGLGFGTGFTHRRLPAALLKAAQKRSFPLFEIPYELPFIAITERAFAELVNERYEMLERSMAGDVLADALSGQLYPEDLQARLRPFGIGGRDCGAGVLAAGCERGGGLARTDPCARAGEQPGGGAGGSALCGGGCERARTGGAGGEDPHRAGGTFGEVRAAASRAAATHSLRLSFHEARCALEAVRMQNGNGPEVATYRDLGAFQLLLSLQDDDALLSYCRNVLGPVEQGEGGYGDELLRSLDVFIESNGHWEKAANTLFCHRHTLRYRIRRVEQLTGRDFSNARDRIEFWLALRGRELAR